MAQRPICSICGKRRAERFCPAKGERICCGLLRHRARSAARLSRRLRLFNLRPPLRTGAPAAARSKRSAVPSVDLSSDVLYKNEAFLSGLGYAVLKFAAERRDLADGDILAALEALAETYRTLVSGIYYEKPPERRWPMLCTRHSPASYRITRNRKVRRRVHLAQGQRCVPFARHTWRAYAG